MAEAYEDDPTITDDTVFWKWVPSLHLDTARQDFQGWMSSGLFKPSSDDGTPTSVVIAAAWQELGLGPADVLKDKTGCFLLQITAGDARALGLNVCPDPETDENTPIGHHFIHGPKNKLRKLKNVAEWILPPPEYVIGTYPPEHIRAQGEAKPQSS